MSTNGRIKVRRFLKVGALGVLTIAGLAACGHMGMHLMGGGHAERPAASEFGLGPRASIQGLYRGTLETMEPLGVRRMQTVHLALTDATGEPIGEASIEVDGGMPEHGHGLPTKPRVTRSLGGGRYEVEGVRFNMGGWWEVSFVISSPQGEDTITFNLDL